MKTQKDINQIVMLAFNAVGLAMPAAVLVLNALGKTQPEDLIVMLGIGLFCVALAKLQDA